jgi:hypothetical protein
MIRENEYSVSENYVKELSDQSFRTQLLDQQENVVDLNLLLKNCWKRFENCSFSQMAARLDPLPVVEGDEKQWHYVIDGLISMIMQHPPKSFFFLHIECDLYTTNARLKKGFRSFQIHFKTNITANESWFQLNNKKIKKIEKTVGVLKGSFAYNRDIENGCLFSISLSGKQV